MEKPKKKRKPRAHEQMADKIMGKIGVGADTTSRTGAVARTFLSKGLRSTMGQSGSLRNKLMAHAFTSGKEAAPGDKPRPSLGALIGGHIKDSMTRRFATSDLGRAWGMAKPAAAAARRRGEIQNQKSAGASLRQSRAEARNAPQEEDDGSALANLFAEPEDASGPPPDPIQPPRIEENPVELERDPPLTPVNVSLSGSMVEPSDGKEDKEEKDKEDDD